jgi:hypothetical protein
MRPTIDIQDLGKNSSKGKFAVEIGVQLKEAGSDACIGVN